MANFTGTNSDEIITPTFVSSTVTATGGTLPSNVADFIDGGAGNDTIDAGGGNDTILGGDGNDLLIGGDGDDVVIGGRGTDVSRLGAGNDRFIWNQGEGSDSVDGGDGFDTLEFNGAALAENTTISANGEQATLFRDLGTITMHLNSVERIELAPLGGADNTIVNDLSGTGVKEVAIDLGVSGGVGDGQTDSVTVNGTRGENHINVTASGTMLTVSGLSEQVTIDHGETADLLLVNGGAGNDTIDASTLPAATMALTLDGGVGNDIIIGGRGADSLIGGDGNDTVTGGAGKDTAFLGAGNDKFIWNPGDGSDVVDGEAGTDTLVFVANDVNEVMTIADNGTHVLMTRDLGNITMDLNSIENVVINANGGDDSITGNGLSALTSLTIDGGTGNDTIIGGNGNDLLIGGDGDDVITGGHGNDISRLGAGNDKFIWNQGDGSDSVNGQVGFDTLVFNGAALAENTTISASGEQAILFRDLGTITMHLNSVERIELTPLGGADNTIVNDLTGTGVKQVAIDLAAAGGGGDGQTDSVTVNGRAGDNHINVTASGTMVTVSGLSEQVTIDHGESADLLSIKGGASNDIIDASKLPAATMALTLDGGAGNDIIFGGAGNDALIGGSGNDKFVFNFGATGHDVITDFQVHGGTAQGDVVALAGFSDHTFDQAIADGHIAQSGTDVVISDGAQIVATLQDIALDSLHAQDFLFS